jgi:putative Ca2+/H+ antiporter (TMEM165/GDT1 family)
MSLAIAATVFAVIFLAELPDNSGLAALLLGTRYRPLWVFAGVAAAFAVHVGLAIAAGSLLGLIPRRPLEIVIAIVFAVGAVVVLRGVNDDDDEEELKVKGKAPGFWRVAWTGFAVITIAELGDLTGITTAVLAAHYDHDLASVAIGSVLALWAVGGIAIIGGHSLLRLIPVVWISRFSAALMVALEGLSIAEALT